MQVLAAIVLVSLLVGSLLTFRAIRQAPGSARHQEPLRQPHPTPAWSTSSWSDESDTHLAGALTGVVALSPTDVWAVGEQSNQRPLTTLIEHWDGRRGSAIPSSKALPVSIANNKLSAITAIFANDSWAVGTVQELPSGLWTLIEHRDGQRWHLVPDQGKQFQKGARLTVIALPPGKVWTAGEPPLSSGPCQWVRYWNTGMARAGDRSHPRPA